MGVVRKKCTKIRSRPGNHDTGKKQGHKVGVNLHPRASCRLEVARASGEVTTVLSIRLRNVATRLHFHRVCTSGTLCTSRRNPHG